MYYFNLSNLKNLAYELYIISKDKNASMDDILSLMCHFDTDKNINVLFNMLFNFDILDVHSLIYIQNFIKTYELLKSRDENTKLDIRNNIESIRSYTNDVIFFYSNLYKLREYIVEVAKGRRDFNYVETKDINYFLHLLSSKLERLPLSPMKDLIYSIISLFHRIHDRSTEDLNNLARSILSKLFILSISRGLDIKDSIVLYENKENIRIINKLNVSPVCSVNLDFFEENVKNNAVKVSSLENFISENILKQKSKER